ncbi:hypothetical protein CN938_31155, partial [Bacillus thuringiensis]
DDAHQDDAEAEPEQAEDPVRQAALRPGAPQAGVAEQADEHQGRADDPDHVVLQLRSSSCGSASNTQ